MNFTPLSEAELNAQRGILTPGHADFEVIEAIDTVSKSSGNPMIKLTLKAWDAEGRQGVVFDYLVSNAQWKIKNFFESIGRPETYDSGNIDATLLVGATGKAEIEIQKDTTGKYGDQPKIKDYVNKTGSMKASVKDAAEIFGEDIPF